MTIIDNSTIPQFGLPGLLHQTLADTKNGLKGMEVWMQTIEPGGETPVHFHDCEEAFVVLRGSGRVSIKDESKDFGPNSTIIIGSEIVHQIVNNGKDEIFLIAAFSATPAKVFTPDGEEMPLPWQNQ